MLGTAIAAIHTGIQAEMVRVEADVSRGFPRFSLVGLPDSAVRESKLRIRSAFHNSHLPFPQGRITVNLTPANFRKRGSGLDLAIAVAILRASGQVPADDDHQAFLAELQLSGSLAPVDAAVGLALRIATASIRDLFLSMDQSVPQELDEYITIRPCRGLLDVVDAILQPLSDPVNLPARTRPPRQPEGRFAFAGIRGRAPEKRLLSIAAAGSHHLLLIGPPGIGKTLLASHLVDLLPDLDDHRALEAYARSEASDTQPTLTRRPPMRVPHHTLTPAGMIGGGNPPQPGEVTLAHDGVLLLDELFEFPRNTLNALREPLVENTVHLTRGGRSATLPAHFLLVATANPCPCGQRGYGECRCLDSDVRRYWARCSGPVLDRIDIVQYMNRQREDVPPFTECPQPTNSVESEERLRAQVVSARQILSQPPSGQYPSSQSDERYLTATSRRLLEQVKRSIATSERATTQLLRLSRTIAALDERECIDTADVQEALQLRGSSREPI